MMNSLVFAKTCPNYLFNTNNNNNNNTTTTTTLLQYSSSPLKVHDQLCFAPSTCGLVTSTTFTTGRQAAKSDNYSYSETSELADGSWDNLGLNPVQTDYMYVMKCTGGDNFSDGDIQRFGNIELNPAACVLNYGQGVIESLKAYKKQDNSILVFRPEEYGLRMRMGADRMCMPAPTVDQFVEAVKATVLQIDVPPPNKGFLNIQSLLMGSGPVLSVTPAPEFTFLISVTPAANYFEGGLKPIDLLVETEFFRATPGGVGSVKAIGNYAAIMKAQDAAKANGFSDVLYLDSVHRRYLEEVSTANIFVVKDKTIFTPMLRGTILPGIARKSIIDIARIQGFRVEERLVSVEELFDFDEVFCTGNAICLLPVGSITYLDKRVSYRESGLGVVSQQLYSILMNIQMGLTEDKMGWTVVLK